MALAGLAGVPRPLSMWSLILKQAVMGLLMWWEKGPQSERRSKASRGLGLGVAHCLFHSILLVKTSDQVSHSRDGKIDSDS